MSGFVSNAKLLNFAKFRCGSLVLFCDPFILWIVSLMFRSCLCVICAYKIRVAVLFVIILECVKENLFR